MWGTLLGVVRKETERKATIFLGLPFILSHTQVYTSASIFIQATK